MISTSTAEKAGRITGSVSVIILAIALALATLYGWIVNIIWLLNADSGDSVGQIIVSALGVFIPIIGAIHGWIV
jgi:hypothetical protein